MTNQEIADQKRLADILRLARLQLNEEFMSTHSASQASWLNSARSAWTSTGVLLPFTSKFVYPSEEEVIARGVQIYNSLSAQTVATASVPAVHEQPVVKEPVSIATVSLVQACGDFVLIEEPIEEPIIEPIEEPIIEPIIEPVMEPVIEPVIEPVAEPVAEPIIEPIIEPVMEPIIEPIIEPVMEPAADSLLESKFKSLFTKWGGKGNY